VTFFGVGRKLFFSVKKKFVFDLEVGREGLLTLFYTKVSFKILKFSISLFPEQLTLPVSSWVQTEPIGAWPQLSSA
jgi:hypothetical protein